MGLQMRNWSTTRKLGGLGQHQYRRTADQQDNYARPNESTRHFSPTKSQWQSHRPRAREVKPGSGRDLA